MYAKVKDGVVQEYPFDISALRFLHPNVSFPALMNLSRDDLRMFGVEVVSPTERPTHDALSEKVAEQVPICRHGCWKQSWAVEKLSSDEKASMLRARADEVRAERRRLLIESDWTQCRDTPDAIAACWAPYREALRDIPTQPGFPFEIVWPVVPSL